MRAPDLVLEHRRNNKVQKYMRVTAHDGLFVIGSSADADLRISGEKVAGCHAALRLREDGWFICDLSNGTSGEVGTDGVTLIDQQSTIERRLDEQTVIEIGPHKIKLFAKENKQSFVANAVNQSLAVQGQLSLHQVVVRTNDHILETHILPANKSFVLVNGEEKINLPAPKDGNWVTTEYGKKQVQQRLVPAQEIAKSQKVEIDKDLKKPLMAALCFLMLLTFMGALLTQKTKSAPPDVALDKKSMDMIFNAKTIKKKRAESAKVQTAKARQGGNADAASPSQNIKNSLPDEATAPKAQTKAAQALTSLRESGLNNLIGKIAKRANKQGVMVAAQGTTPDNASAGRAFFSQGTTTMGGGGSAAKEGATFKLGGVGTRGKGGGVSDFSNGTTLSGGTVGQGEVALVDEETIIDGGLDRDAIAEVIKRNIGQIRYCYERQLSSNPDLYGKVMVKFIIGATGDVSDPRIDNSTMKSAMVEGCILRRLAGWKFPLPKGGTTVRVSYPFLFKALE